jgi:hypothetical protein
MKTRNGFVSNSSTSSFVIYGIKVEGCYALEEMGVKINPDEQWEELEHVCSKFDLDFIPDDEDGGFYIGVDPSEGMHDDETRRQFRDRVTESLRRMLGNSKQFQKIEAAGDIDTYSGEMQC